jgi:hypothetical protein
LAAGGRLIVCDHLPQGDRPTSGALHSTVEEQHRAMASAGLQQITTNLELNGLYICSARRLAP